MNGVCHCTRVSQLCVRLEFVKRFSPEKNPAYSRSCSNRGILFVHRISW